MSRKPILLALSLFTLALAPSRSATAAADDRTGQVRGSGQALVTDPLGGVSSDFFALAGTGDARGAPRGSINFVFGPEFSSVWGAVPGVDAIHVQGKVASISVNRDGAITLSGTCTERDLSRGGGVLTFEDEPFEVVIHDSGYFTFTWCELPVFDFAVADGDLDIRGYFVVR